MSEKNITPAQRMALFNQSTRQNIHMLPTVTGNGGSQTLQMQLPKSRLLSKIMVKVTAELTATATADKTVGYDPNKLIRRFSVDLNNGFSPFTVTGKELHLYNRLSIHSKIFEDLNVKAADRKLSATTTGKKTTVTTYYELPLTLNDRDSQGIILLQNAETNVTFSTDIGVGGDLLTESNSGVTVSIGDVKIEAATMTFSLPAVQEAFPDLSVLKLVNGVAHSFMGSGENVIKLSTGTIYRKLIFIFEDENGAALTPDDFTANISLVFNQADINYSVSADMLRKMNTIEMNSELPDGVFFLDFSSQGFTNYGGTRDLIDTELLTEFWVKFGTSKRGRVSIVSECIARVR